MKDTTPCTIFFIVVTLFTRSLLCSADPVLIGSGLISAAGAPDGGERLNVSEANTQTVGPGTWQVSEFMFAGNSAAGTVIPFIGSLTGADTYEAIWVGAPVNAQSGVVAVSPESAFTLAASTQLYSGFYTEGGGRVSFAASGVTDHDNAYPNPTTGSTVDTFSNPNLARSYSFALAITPASTSIQLGSGPQWSTGSDSGDRLNVDQAYGRQLSAGVYTIDQFSYFGTAATGTVTPFLALSTGVDSYDVAWVGDPVASQNGLVTDAPNQLFAVPTDGRYLPGFFTTGGRVAFSPTSNNDPYALTDHQGAFTDPTTGSSLAGFSNPDLKRRYAFDLTLSAIPEPSSVSLILLGLLVLGRCRSAL
ncbi:MAG: hypothetical protein ACI9QL_002822 [Candidatus Omnitrophota bacterium]|jgi:hypothetical protein